MKTRIGKIHLLQPCQLLGLILVRMGRKYVVFDTSTSVPYYHVRSENIDDLTVIAKFLTEP